MAPKGGAVFFTCLVLLANAASACIFIFGDAPNATGARPSMLKPETFFDFHVLGQDWCALQPICQIDMVPPAQIHAGIRCAWHSPVASSRPSICCFAFCT
mmetsp:Transcript_4525/g.13101  ORF Transcript_4525/g.13101 Transcript_4525/m.13101 type:complete len:100 (-) Transcript_4525:953-1252(-)